MRWRWCIRLGGIEAMWGHGRTRVTDTRDWFESSEEGGYTDDERMAREIERRLHYKRRLLSLTINVISRALMGLFRCSPIR